MARRGPGDRASDARSTYHIAWHCAALSSSEHCTFIEFDDGYEFVGVVVAPLAALPCHLEYSVTVDRQWRVREVTATIATSLGLRELHVRSLASGSWALDGVTTLHLEGRDDVDLGWTPATNTIPIRRLDLKIGETRDIAAVWIRFPELDAVRNVQTYTRLASDRWRYQSGDFDFELEVDASTGLVLNYGDELWRACAVTVNARV